jgi:hypothetical protein
MTLTEKAAGPLNEPQQQTVDRVREALGDSFAEAARSDLIRNDTDGDGVNDELNGLLKEFLQDF